MAATSIPPSALNVLKAVPELSGGDNWPEFSKGMAMFFRAVSLPGIASGEKPTDATVLATWNAVDAIAAAQVWVKVAPEHRYLVGDCDTASLAWTKLKAQFEATNMFSRMRAREELYNIEHNPSLPIDAYIHAMSEKRSTLTALDVKIDDKEFIDVLLMRLHPSYHTIRTTIVTQATEPKLDAVKSFLQAASAAHPIKQEDVPHALRAATSFKTRSAASASPRLPPPNQSDGLGFKWCDTTFTNGCHRCGRGGHTAARCMRDMPAEVKAWILSNSVVIANLASAAGVPIASIAPTVNLEGIEQLGGLDIDEWNRSRDDPY